MKSLHTENRVHPSGEAVLIKRNVKLQKLNYSQQFTHNKHSKQISNNTEDSDTESTHSVVEIQPSTQNWKKRRWIATTFMKKECARYVPKPSGPDEICCCGRLKNQHIRDALRPQLCTTSTQTGVSESRATLHSKEDGSVGSESSMNSWNKHRDVIELPTDSFGKIEFLTGSEASSRVAHYVRISNETHPKDVLNLLSKHWKMPIPHLAISVAGGTKNFILNKQDQDTFNRGLVKAAQTVGAWIISTGVNCGVHKAVGEAVREGQVMRWISNRGQARAPIHCIGVAPWSYVENWQSLVSRQGEGLYPAQYKVNPIVQRGKPVSLDPHHTHFLLIDDGTRFYGCDVPYRAKLEQAMRAPKFGQNQLETGLGIPVVKVCLEGGLDTILATKEAVLLKTPVVFCEGTGRAADLLAFANKNCVMIDGVRKIKPSVRDTVYERIHTVCRISKDHHMIPNLKEAIDVTMQHESMITIFNMAEGEHAELDLAVLKALLKGQSASPASQLKLALSWGRVDVAESMIFVGINDWPPGSLDSFVTQALMENRVDFLQLFLEKGAIMKEYLTVARLRDLYNKAEPNNFIRKLLADKAEGLLSGPFYLHHVRTLIRSLMGAHEAPLYHHDRNISTIGPECRALVAMSTCLSGFMLPYEAQVEFMNTTSNNDQISIGDSFSVAELVNPGMHFPRPFRELFLWAVLVSRMDLAEFFWERGEDPVCLAIVASRMFRSMSHRALDPDDKLRLLENSRQFEKLATCVIDECFDTDEELAQMMIEIPHQQWGGMNTLTIAAESEAEEFISRPCAQAVLQNIWMDGMRCTSLKAFLVLLFPPLLLMIPYRKDYGSATIWKKLWMFYNAPVTKFFGGLITYILLLLLMSYVLIFEFGDYPSIWEHILFAWICTLIIEEFRQLAIPNEFETLYQKVYQWKRSVWNWIDASMLSLACLGYGFHLTGNSVKHAAKGCYSASCFFFYVRLLRMYAVSTKLGPKMVMIRKMIQELVLFLCILLVFMVGYGVASQSLLFPNQTSVLEAITGIFYMPYFQILGELFLEVTIEGKLEDCSNDPVDGQHRCPEQHILVSVLLVIYLLVGNVLLLNLLIAIFSFVFDEVQSKALQIWKYELYALVMEYADRPAIPAPFIIFQHIFMSLSWLYGKAYVSCTNEPPQKGPLYNAKKKIELRVFEKECAATYRRKKANFESSQVTEKVDRIEKRLEESLKQAENNKDDLNQQFMNLKKNINKRSHPPDMPTRQAFSSYCHEPPERDVPPKAQVKVRDVMPNEEVRIQDVLPDAEVRSQDVPSNAEVKGQGVLTNAEVRGQDVLTNAEVKCQDVLINAQVRGQDDQPVAEFKVHDMPHNVKGENKKFNEHPVKDYGNCSDGKNQQDVQSQKFLIENEILDDSDKQLRELAENNNTITNQVGLFYQQVKPSTSLINQFEGIPKHQKKKRSKVKRTKKHYDPENPLPREQLKDDESASDLEQTIQSSEDNLSASLANLQVIARHQATAFVDLKRGIDLQMQLVQARLRKLEEESQGNKNMLERIEHMLERISNLDHSEAASLQQPHVV